MEVLSLSLRQRLGLRLDGIQIPETFQTGGIVGEATITDCVTGSGSYWFNGPYGFVLEDAKELPFYKCPGKLGLFEVDDDLPARS